MKFTETIYGKGQFTHFISALAVGNLEILEELDEYGLKSLIQDLRVLERTGVANLTKRHALWTIRHGKLGKIQWSHICISKMHFLDLRLDGKKVLSAEAPYDHQNLSWMAVRKSDLKIGKRMRVEDLLINSL